MRKLVAFNRPRRAPMAQVEECIAHLHEELDLTTAFTGAMVRMGNYRAAIGVLDEQRARVRQVPAHFDRAFARPRRKAKAAIAGLAAAALLGSGALAAWVTPDRAEAARENRVRIQKAVDMLTRAQQAKTSDAANGWVAVATNELRGLDPKVVEPDPLVPDELRDAFELLKTTDKVSGQVLSMAIAAANEAGLKVEPPPAPEPPQQSKPPAKPGADPAVPNK